MLDNIKYYGNHKNDYHNILYFDYQIKLLFPISKYIIIILLHL